MDHNVRMDIWSSVNISDSSAVLFVLLLRRFKLQCWRIFYTRKIRTTTTTMMMITKRVN